MYARVWLEDYFELCHVDLIDYANNEFAVLPYDELEGGNVIYREGLERLEWCSGVLDKNGRPLYVNDIVKVRRQSQYELHIVEFKDGVFFAGYHHGSSTTKRKKLLRSCDLVKVGNTHENLHLLRYIGEVVK
jgi:hypothetical protein